MKRKRSTGKTVLSLCLAILLFLQTVMFSVTANAEIASDGFGTASVSEAVYTEPDEPPSADEPPSVPGVVYAPPLNLAVIAVDPRDKTAVLTNANPTFKLTVKQGSPDPVVIPEGGEINGRGDFTLALEDIAVPTKGDDITAPPESVIQQGDYAVLDKATYFPDVNLTPAGPTNINQGNLKIATVQFFADSIKITFDGAGVYDGSRRDVKVGFSATAKAADQTPGGGRNTAIFGDGYKFKNSDLVPEYSIDVKSASNGNDDSEINIAHFQEGTITWRAVVTATDRDDKTIPMPLDGLTFSDELTDVGVYVPGTFTVDGKAVEPDYADGKISYKFPNESTAEKVKNTATITFKTWIPKDKYYYEKNGAWNQYGWTRVANTAQLLGDPAADVKASSNTHQVAMRPNWIVVGGKPGKSGNDTLITWTVEVNKAISNGRVISKTDLQNVKITDILPPGTEFVSATYKNGDGGTDTPITRNASGEYEIGTAIGGNLSGPLYMTIVTKVTDSSKSTFDYKARANWELDVMAGESAIQNNDATGWTAPTAVVDTARVIIGAHAFTKAAETHTTPAYALYNVAGAKWKISLTLQYDLDAPIVYDLLVHGDSLAVLDNLDANPKVSLETLNALKSSIDTKQLWQKYRENTLTLSNGLTGEVIPLTVNGEPVADLIKVTGFKGNVKGDVSFETVTTNPDNLFRQDNKGDWSNRGLLFDGDSYQASYDATVKNRVRMLNKEMLYASSFDENGNALGNIAADWNRNYGNWSASIWTRPIVVNDPNLYMDNTRGDNYILAGYDRKDRTVTFRLAVNMPGFKTEEMAKDGGNRVASDIKLVDTLPEGWEFVDYAPGEAYRLYIGVTGYNVNSGLGGASGGGYGQYAQASGLPIQPNDPKHVVSFTKNGNVGTFTFSKLESPYVILVKARPTNAKLATYQLGNNNAGENQADFSMKWGDKPYSATEKHRIIVPVKSLSKTVKKPVSGVQEWTVNYTPPFEMKQGVYLLDTLAKGLKLRQNAEGGLSLAPSDIAVYPGKMKPDGTLERAGGPLNLADPNSEVKVTAGIDSATGGSTLRFDFADPNKLYQIVYQTESQGMQPGAAGNSIKLMGDDALPPIGAQSSITLDANDVAGSANENGLLFLKKVGPDGTTPLKGVKFQLFNPDGTPAKDKEGNVMPEKTTGTDGKTDFIIQVPGDYLLKQTYIDLLTYLPTTTEYRVRIIDAPGKPVLVNGQKVEANNPLIVPTPAQGKLTITNKVEGNGSDPDKEFEYTVTFSGEGKDGEYTYKKPDNTYGKIKSGDKITLKHGQTVTLPILPANLVYTVTEGDYTTVDGYTTKPETRELSGTIVFKGDHKADFINERVVSKLTISNTVMGNGADKTKEFEYTVSFEDAGKDGSYSYEKSDGSKGTIKSGGTFRLKDGETLDILDLPKNLKYTVTQTDYTTDEYVTTPQERYYTGVMEGNDKVAPFTNVRVLKGGLLISNTVKGKDDDKKKLFKYTITFTGEGADKSYVYKKSDGTTGMIKSGETFELTDGQTFIVQGLPTYLQYTVTQDDYKQDGYVTDPESLVRTGAIPEKIAAEAHFVNTRPYLEGVLRDNNTGEVIPNAEIILTNKKTNETQKIRTDEKGEYSIPAEADTDYTITYTKMYQAGGKDVPVKFTQKANVDSSVKDETVPADITAVGIVRFKQLDGTEELFNESFTSNMHIYLKDKNNKYIEENGKPKAFPMAANGTFSVEGLSEQKYTMEVRYKAETGEELLFKVSQLDVKANGELNISDELVDPYGTVYDETTGDASTGKKIDGAKVTLYYANTQRNIDNGRIPGTKVTLPKVPNFPPHDNESPEQDSDANGFYAYMVFPEADYYLIVTKDGYETHRSDTISVDFDIVKYDVPMKPISSDGGGGGTVPEPEPEPGTPEPEPGQPEPSQPEPGNPGPAPVNPGPTQPDNPGSGGGGGTDNDDDSSDKDDDRDDSSNNEADNHNAGPVDVNSGTDNVDNGPGNVDNGSDDIDNEPGDVNNGVDNIDIETGDVNNEAGNVDNGTSDGDNEVGNVDNEANNGNNGVGNINNITNGSNNELDDVPETGDRSPSPIFYMILALMSLITIGFCLLTSKKKKNIQ
ncbi:carboxypeptidase regulatory-like domain-containing protein [Paenibacillus sp. P96]|uniref:Carboxypeptidase regulatory-like domain-containing protein n=1 Tax=Paenibacillus zeirhizosphaerae TaxID=2987519 RepID=A0ABT9FNT8_9BACL|nr:carboxypeptidase regulatory-like domain-containing protein [Paenibacillus sp. P96]MDP4096394.1 carboxypeptidase regulatory-like domain-containing protein [Paenibacillus sp. P96]